MAPCWRGDSARGGPGRGWDGATVVWGWDQPMGVTTVWGQFWVLVLALEMTPQCGDSPRSVRATVVRGQLCILVLALGVPLWPRDGLPVPSTECHHSVGVDLWSLCCGCHHRDRPVVLVPWVAPWCGDSSGFWSLSCGCHRRDGLLVPTPWMPPWCGDTSGSWCMPWECHHGTGMVPSSRSSSHECHHGVGTGSRSLSHKCHRSVGTGSWSFALGAPPWRGDRFLVLTSRVPPRCGDSPGDGPVTFPLTP